MSDHVAVASTPWLPYRLGDVATRITERNSVGNNNVLTVSAQDGLVDQESYFRKRVASADLAPYFLLKPGDFVYSKSYSEGYPVGAILRLRGSRSGIVSPLYICFRTNPAAVDGRFFEHYFQSGVLNENIALITKEGARNHGLLNVSVQDFMNLSISLPPLSEQRRIAEILDAVNNQIFASEQCIEKFRQIEWALQSELIGNLVTAASSSSNGWRWSTVRETGTIQLGRQRSPEHESGRFMAPYLRVANVFDGYVDYSDVLTMNFTPSERNIYDLHPGDILLNEGQSIDLVGRCAIYDGPQGIYFQNTLIRYRSNQLVPEFSRAIFKYWLETGEFTRIAKQTTSVAHLGATRFAAMPIPIASTGAQLRIVKILSVASQRVSDETAGVRKLRLIRQGLMDDLLTGRVRVPV